jgi:hypothetical protein
MIKIKFSLVPICAVLAVLQLSSCAAIRRMKCNKEYAAKKGMEDADAGRTSMPARLEGNNCSDEYSPSDFSKDYNYGFMMKKNEICQVTEAAKFGRTDGENGASNRPTKSRLGICKDVASIKKLEATYEAEFKKSYCAPARATKLGSARAASWQISDFETAFSDCKTGVSTLANAYKVAYNDTMKSNCTVDAAAKMAVDEANARRDGSAGPARFNNCTTGKDAALAAFDKTFKENQARVAKADADAAAKAAADARAAKVNEFMRTTATSSFPFQLRNYVTRCNVADDKSHVRVEVENAYPEQILIQGNWKLQYFNNDFAKITEDRTTEALLLTGNNKKTFQKLTLPKDATFCRADFIGAATN